jgi:hypothetical protein
MPSRRGVECWPPGRADRRDVTMSEPELFTPTTIGAIRVANRIAMAPLTRARAGMDGVQSPLAIEYYRQRASAGLIISEATNISRQGRGYAFTPRHLHRRPSRGLEARGAGGARRRRSHRAPALPRRARVAYQPAGERGGARRPSAIRAGEQTYIESGLAPPSMPRRKSTQPSSRRSVLTGLSARFHSWPSTAHSFRCRGRPSHNLIAIDRDWSSTHAASR